MLTWSTWCTRPKNSTILSVVAVASLFVIVVIIIIAGQPADPDEKYCNLESCEGENHTMCIYPKEVHESCGDCFEIGVKPHQREIFTDFYSSHSRTSFGSKASDTLFSMNWNRELAMIAQRWVNQCFEGEDECRDTPKMDVSQIVFHKQGSKKSRQAEPDGIADALTTSTTESSSGSEKPEAVALGCGYLKCRKNGVTEVRIACNYGPYSPDLVELMTTAESPENLI